jgi:hypothetical protein
MSEKQTFARSIVRIFTINEKERVLSKPRAPDRYSGIFKRHLGPSPSITGGKLLGRSPELCPHILRSIGLEWFRLEQQVITDYVY